MKTLTLILVVLLASMPTAFGEENASADHSAKRLISTPTAIPGDTEIDGVVQMHTFLGVAYTLGGSLRFSRSLTKKLHVGLGSNVGVAFTALGGGSPAFIGGGPVLSYGTEEFFVNAGASYYLGFWDGDQEGVFLPSIGISGRVSKNVRLHLEGMVPMAHRFDELEFGVVTYGVRVGRTVYGDFSMILPVGKDMDKIFEVFPLGLPVIGVGIVF